MVEQGNTFDDSSTRRISRSVRFTERMPPMPPRTPPPPRQPAGRPPIRAVLLEDLNSNGTAEVAVLDWVPDNDVQAAKLIGSVDGGTFKITYNGTVAVPVTEETTDIAFDANGPDVLAALVALPSLTVRTVKVDGFPGLWFIQFLGQPIGSVASLTLDDTNLTGGNFGAAIIGEHWEDSGRPETVFATIPVGPPTPMRAGAIVVAIWITGARYCVIAVEPRDWFKL